MAWHAGEGMGWWMLVGGILSIAFWATIIYLVLALVRGGRTSRDGATGAAGKHRRYEHRA